MAPLADTESLFALHRVGLLRYLSRAVGHPDTARDLTQDVFLMREVAGLSYAEVATACDLTVAAVRSRIHRARLELRGRLRTPIDLTRARPLRARFP